MTAVVNQSYKYAELCLIFNEQQRTGNARKAQLNRWKRFIDWVKPTTQIYKITEVYEKAKEITDGRRNNGGVRAGAGAKVKMQEEFEYVLNCYMFLWISRYNYSNPDGRRSGEIQIYFTNKDISEYFGLQTKDFNKGYEDGTINKEAFSMVGNKIREIRDSWIFDKIKKMEGMELTNGIIAYKNKKKNEFEFRDDLLAEWNMHQEEYCRENKLHSIGDVIDKGRWFEMIRYISMYFSQYEEVIRCKKITLGSTDYLEEFDLDEYKENKKLYNERIIESLTNYFRKKTAGIDANDEKAAKFEDYVKIINKYVRIYEDK